MEDIIKMRDTLRSAADILDEFITLEDKEKSGEDITKDTESILGRFMMKMIEMQALSNKI